jgi:nickel transport protein
MKILHVQFIMAAFIVGFHLLFPQQLSAHGALMEYAFTPGITILAKYDSGHPMPGAQVTVYAPDNPAKPWLTGVSDEQGRFSFVPDPEKAGTWTIQARLAGHGSMIHIPLVSASGPDTDTVPVSAGPSTSQRLLMAVMVIWGFIGTALFFSRNRIGRGTV